jgi:A/G-specific adenine glycosylase
MLWETARSLLPRRRFREYNWALLDLAKKLCRPVNPRCFDCPLNTICEYYQARERSTQERFCHSATLGNGQV